MKKFFKILSFCLCTLFIFSSCKSSSNVGVEKLKNKVFSANDNGSIGFPMDKVNIKYPDYCWNKYSGVIVDKNGKVFKKPSKDESFFEAFNPKIEVKNGKKYINADSKFYPNDRFELKDEFTILDTLLGIEYVDIVNKYGIEYDNNEYLTEYKEAKQLAKNYKEIVKDIEDSKNELPSKIKAEIEREMEIDRD